MVVIDSSYCASAENHAIFGQCSSFITKHILNLTKFFGDVHCTAFGTFIRMWIIEIDAIMNDENLKEFAHLNCDIKC